MTVKEIIKQFLKGRGYDGLYYSDGDGCACELSNLFPCDGDWGGCCSCEAGIYYPLLDDEDFRIGPKPEEKEE